MLALMMSAPSEFDQKIEEVRHELDEVQPNNGCIAICRDIEEAEVIARNLLDWLPNGFYLYTVSRNPDLDGKYFFYKDVQP